MLDECWDQRNCGFQNVSDFYSISFCVLSFFSVYTFMSAVNSRRAYREWCVTTNDAKLDSRAAVRIVALYRWNIYISKNFFHRTGSFASTEQIALKKQNEKLKYLTEATAVFESTMIVRTARHISSLTQTITKW